MEMERKYQEYKDINEQVLYLYKSKKIIVDVEDRHYLEERNYVSLVKPYKAFFSTGRNNKGKLVYKKETNFKEVIKLVNLDDAYAKMLYELIGVFERKFKSVLFAEICHNYVTCDNSDIYNTLELLYKTSDLTLTRIEEINVKVNPSNSRIVRILNMMYENISLTNK